MMEPFTLTMAAIGIVVFVALAMLIRDQVKRYRAKQRAISAHQKILERHREDRKAQRSVWK